ncbi:TlpA family protein disulfide reductase [Thalassomonas viridans]|uniref:TlpA family protein disulfide reductase n=1 Tax=Thalassomonas viridans TaxID=137584 RepID=A0AAE9Z2Z2_9GAMM|nr:TlpA disulfide reductase family protein [Thalassomonas viridans]WDE05613.1 TlpA family protein disulfide reductase [Thalassomonas viridans]
MRKLFALCCYLILAALGLSAYAGEAKSPTSELARQLEQHSGKIIYLDFWASWCGPCRKSFPWMSQMQAQYQQQGFVVLSVNLDHNKKFADEFLQQVPADFPVIYDPRGELMKQYKIKGMPSSYLFDRSGKIISRHAGFSEEKMPAYEQDIRNALASSGE